jgi:nickel transport protein
MIRESHRAIAALVWLLLTATGADAHLLKAFATVEDGEISGFAFFVGGGRPSGAEVKFVDPTGAVVARLTTNDEGRFRWVPGVVQRYTVSVDAGDGHIAEAVIEADRLGGAAVAGSPTDSVADNGGSGSAPVGGIDPAQLEQTIQRAVDRAVERQVRPLLEAYAQAENRVRFNDVVGGIGMIVGLAGVALWFSGRRSGGGGEGA